MIKWIELTCRHRGSMLVNMNKVSEIAQANSGDPSQGTRLWNVEGDMTEVKETYDEIHHVLKQVMERS